jgi:N-acetylmuramic acid 6-phosphate etherase
MLEHLGTEQQNPASAEIDLLSTEQILAIMNQEDKKVAAAVEQELSRVARAVDTIVGALERGGRLFYIGAGTSGRLGVLDASECPPTFGVPPEIVQGVIAGGEGALSRATEASEDSPEAGENDLRSRGFNRNDVLVGITASGRTPYVLGAIRYAKSLGAPTIGLTCNAGAEISALVDVAIAPHWIDSPESRHCSKDGLEYAFHCLDDPARLCIPESHGESPAQERKTARSRPPDRRSGGGLRFWTSSAGPGGSGQ